MGVAALSRNATGSLLAKVAKNAMNAKHAKHMITGAFPTMGPDAFDKTGDWINKFFKKERKPKTTANPRNQYGMSFAVVNARYTKNAANAKHAKESVNAMRAGKAGRARYSKQALVAQYAVNARYAKLATNALRAWKVKNAMFAHGAVNAEFARKVITEAPTTTANTTTLVPDINTTKSPVTMD